MKRDEAIQELRAARKELQETLADFSEEDYLRANAIGKWTSKDLLAHVASWDEEMVRVLQTFPMPGESVYTYAISDRNKFAAWNEEQVALRREHSVSQVIAEFEGARRDLIQVIEGLTDAVLNRSRMTSWGVSATGFELILAQAARDRENAAQVRSYRKKMERWARARKTLSAKRKTKN
ncbi:MAG: DinB family protein [Chloroflexi bacterium]|nr:DinB family protein [Chloroflexota bacterium]